MLHDARMRILIAGPPAAGKSTLAHDLANRMLLPVHHVDALRWVSPTQRRSQEELRLLVEEAVGGPAWVAEGSVGPTVNAFASAADLIVFLDYPRRVTLVRLLKRWAQRRRIGMPSRHVERPSLFALRFNWTWRRRHRGALVADLATSGAPTVQLSRPRRDLLDLVVTAARP